MKPNVITPIERKQLLNKLEDRPEAGVILKMLPTECRLLFRIFRTIGEYGKAAYVARVEMVMPA